MKQIEHFIQDACELLAVAEMQLHAEELGLSKRRLSPERMREYEEYVRNHKITAMDFAEYPQYRDNIKKHVHRFVERLAAHRPFRDIVFNCTERESRNKSMKGDFAIQIDGATPISVSLKNYRNSIGRPQVSAGTFNSFALSFLLIPAPGVGMYINTHDGSVFRGSQQTRRNQVLRNSGSAWALKPLDKLDELNQQIKQTFVYSDEYEFLSEDKFDAERKRVGAAGAEIVFGILSALPPSDIRRQIVERIGFAGTEEQLMFDPERYTDSITVSLFRDLINAVRHDAHFDFRIKGQGIAFEFSHGRKPLLGIHVPFTINKNGAWISETYSGTRLHPKEGVRLATGQRRPKKSKELATSINTYLDLESTGIFIKS